MPTFQRITPFLWFADEAEEAARFYTGIFPNSRITTISRYSEAGQEVHGRTPGSVMVVDFELDGQSFRALNGGPAFTFNESISFQVNCRSQEEVDRYWDALSAGGDPKAQQCGWLKDRYGVSWQVVPDIMGELFGGGDAEGARRATEAMLKMKKIDVEALRRAHAGAATARP